MTEINMQMDARAYHADHTEAERDQSQADRALARLEKADAELAMLLDRLADRLRPVRHLDTSYEDGECLADPPSMRSPLVLAIDSAADRCAIRSRLVVEITEGLDI